MKRFLFAALLSLLTAAARAQAEGARSGAEAEQARIAAIMTSEHAAGREALASHFAFKTRMPAADAVAALQAAPKQEAPRGRMPTPPVPNVDSGDGAEGRGDHVAALKAALPGVLRREYGIEPRAA